MIVPLVLAALVAGSLVYCALAVIAAVRYRSSFATAVTLAIMGHHLRIITARVMEAEFTHPGRASQNRL